MENLNNIIEEKDSVDGELELELIVNSAQISKKNIKVLSVEEVSNCKDKSQFKEEVTKEYAKMINNDIRIAYYEDFARFKKEGLIYVDKSLFIKHVLDKKSNLVITCPRRWGKSLNLSMLKAFLQPDGEDKTHYKDGKYDFSRGNKNLKLFIGGKIKSNSEVMRNISFKPLKIALDPKKDYVKEYQGQYPVIYLTLDDVDSIILGDAKEDKDEIPDLEKKLRKAISDSYMEHKYLVEWIKENDDEVDKIDYLEKFYAYKLQKNKYYDCQGVEKDANLNQSLQFLGDLLYEYYGKRVFLLIDEFDTPVKSYLAKGNNILDNIKGAKLIAKKVSNIIEPCIKNDKINQTIIVGILNSLVLETNSSINNFKEEGVLTGELGEYIGFNNDEINWVLDQVFTFDNNTNYKKLLFDKLKEWYNGQIIGEAEVFTPFSIMNYLKELLELSTYPLNTVPIFDEFWSLTVTTSILIRFIRLAIDKGYDRTFLKLANISINRPAESTYEANIKLIDILERFTPKNEESCFEELCFYYLSKLGYITRIKGELNKYKIPAKEIEGIYKRNLAREWKEELFLNKNEFKIIVKEIDFFSYDKSDVDKKMNNALKLVTPKYSSMKEEVFRIVLHQAIENSSVENKFIDVEFNSGLGRADLVFYYDSVVNLFVLKFVDSKKNKAILEEELKLIYEKNYMKGILEFLKKEKKYRKLNVETIKLIPIVLFRVTNNTEWQYKTGTIKNHTIDDAYKIVEKMEELAKYKNQYLLVDHLFKGNNIESFESIIMSKQELISEINKLENNLKNTLIERLQKDKKKKYTEEEAKAINPKESPLIAEIFKRKINTLEISKKFRLDTRAKNARGATI